jgi:hypothetical protein
MGWLIPLLIDLLPTQSKKVNLIAQPILLKNILFFIYL